MKIVKELFAKINRDDIDENMQDLVSNELIDSLDIMELITEIEKYFGKSLDAKFIESDNFESFSAIDKMLKMAFK